MKFDTNYTKLKNGVRVLTIPMPGVESVTSLVLVKTGSRNETDKQLGISHVLEHMMLKASSKYPTQMELASAIDRMGAEHNAYTSKEYTGYYITAAAMHLTKALEILGDVMTSPLLKQENLATELGVITEEINMYEDLPMERALEEFENLMFEGNKLGRLIIGNKRSVNGLEETHIRQYYQRWYKGANVLVILAGKVERGLELEPYFGQLPQSGLEPYVEKGGYGAVLKQHIKKETEQAHFVMGVPAVGMEDPQRYPLLLARVALGGNMSSRLFNEIREKRGLAYYVSAIFDTSYDAGYFGVRAGVKLEKLAEAKKVVREELLKLAETITEEEIEKARDYLLGRLPLQLDTTREVAAWMGQRVVILDEVKQPAEAIEAVKGVTIEEVRGVLAELVKDGEMRTCVVGPRFG